MGMRSVTALPRIQDGGVLSQHISLPPTEKRWPSPTPSAVRFCEKKTPRTSHGACWNDAVFQVASQPVNRLRCFASA
jgi:hypothetical protein